MAAGAAHASCSGRGVYVGSAGVRKGELDPFAVAAHGRDRHRHRASTGRMTFEELEDWEGLNFDLIVTLSPEAHHRALELTRTLAVEVEYWPTADPTAAEGSREQRSTPTVRCATSCWRASRRASRRRRARNELSYRRGRSKPSQLSNGAFR